MSRLRKLKELLLGLLTLALVFPSAALAWDEGRIARPVQMQMNMMGGGLLGYHINEVIYIGGYQANPYSRDTTTEDPNNRTEATINYQTGMVDQMGYESRRQVVEIRLTPWAFGLYIAGGYMRHAEESNTYYFDKRARLVGSGAYTTGFQMQVDTPAYEGPTFGMGINHVTENGFSFGFGVSVASQPAKGTKVTLSNWDVDPSAADLALFQANMDNWAERSPSGAAIFGLGYNF